MKEVIADIDRWQAAGRRVAVARVIGVEGSGPRDPGATMAVSEEIEALQRAVVRGVALVEDQVDDGEHRDV